MYATAALVCTLASLSSTNGFGMDHQMTTIFHESSVNSIFSPNLIATSTTAIQNPLTPIFEKYMSTLTAFPLPTKMLTGAALATAGDAIAQQREDDEYDPSRGASFAAFDMIYRAAQHWLFPIIVELCRGQILFSVLSSIGASQLVDSSTLTAMERALASQLVIVPFLYYPVFFTFTGYMQGLNVQEGLERAKQNFVPLMKRNLLFWIPVQYVQFCYLPTDLQIPFLSCAGLAWTFILSIMAGSAKKYSKDAAEHETYCVIGTEQDCVIPEDEILPFAFDDFDENALNGEVSEDNGAAIEEKEREGVSMK